ncbi:MAG: fibronectin type III domain-containing protein [Thermoflexales bacterium]|nr:fibronectin type III domain-containing protein [Thermoflexales bacterium]
MRLRWGLLTVGVVLLAVGAAQVAAGDHVSRSADPISRDPAVEAPAGRDFSPISQAVSASFSTPSLNFEGMVRTDRIPPDTVGDVGPNHYIQLVNGNGTQVSIYDKQGVRLAGPFTLASLWEANGGSAGDPCTIGRGDPIPLYDQLADRWLLSEFASTGNHLCVYISRDSDPVISGWYVYDFSTPETPDYPKYAVWPDAYYVSTNESVPAVYALDRAKMLAGDSGATFQRFWAPELAGFDFQALIPGDLDGATPPPAGSPNYFLRHRDDEVHNPGANDPSRDFLEVWEFRVDFDTPANSSFAKALDIEVAEFDSTLCGLNNMYCFPQPGGSLLDPIAEVVMWRLQYRNFGAYETLLGNFTVDVGADRGGIRWFELRKAGSGDWGLHQEGTYAPDAANRWIGGIAMDAAGNIALGYSVSSSSVYPSIRYAGRLATDTLGTLPWGEYNVVAGTGSQASNRWGDYSAMSVDPADDCTFWYTNEYIPAGGAWRTRIASFGFLAAPGVPALGIPADGASGLPLTPTLTWAPLAQAEGYRVEIAADPAFASSLISATVHAGTSFTPTSALDAGAIYYWRVRAENVCGMGGWSAISAFRTEAVMPVVADYGDLPGSYGVAWHSGDGAVRLGSAWTAGGHFGAGDDDDDDDGVAREQGPWLAGRVVSLSVTVEGGDGYLVGWFDWNGDGDFAGPQEEAIAHGVQAGSNVISLSVPLAYTAGTQLAARFRLYTGEPASRAPLGAESPAGGEVEDYSWAFTPSAVTLTALAPRPPAVKVASQAIAFISSLGTLKDISLVHFVLCGKQALLGPFLNLFAPSRD